MVAYILIDAAFHLFPETIRSVKITECEALNQPDLLGHPSFDALDGSATNYIECPPEAKTLHYHNS